MDLNSLEEALTDFCQPPVRIAVLGIGHYLRTDDFVGVAIIHELQKEIQKDSVLLLEGEIAPIDFFPKIQEWNPTHLLIIDAAQFNAKPGTFNLILREQMATFTLSSHKRALTLLIDLLSIYLPDLKTMIIGIQPETLEFEIGLSQTIKETVQKLSALLICVLAKV